MRMQVQHHMLNQRKKERKRKGINIKQHHIPRLLKATAPNPIILARSCRPVQRSKGPNVDHTCHHPICHVECPSQVKPHPQPKV